MNGTSDPLEMYKDIISAQILKLFINQLEILSNVVLPYVTSLQFARWVKS